MALNTPLHACGPELQNSVIERVKYRRGDAKVKVRLEQLLLEDKIGVALQIGDKWASRKVDSHMSAWFAVDEMIDELWPLELEPPAIKARTEPALVEAKST